MRGVVLASGTRALGRTDSLLTDYDRNERSDRGRTGKHTCAAVASMGAVNTLLAVACWVVICTTSEVATASEAAEQKKAEFKRVDMGATGGPGFITLPWGPQPSW